MVRINTIVLVLMFFTNTSCVPVNSNRQNNIGAETNKIKNVKTNSTNNIQFETSELVWSASSKVISDKLSRIIFQTNDMNKTMSRDDQEKIFNNVWIPIATKLKANNISIVDFDLVKKVYSKFGDETISEKEKCNAIKKIGKLTSSDGYLVLNIKNSTDKFIINYGTINSETCYVYASREFKINKR